jgi:hypothetical protein
LRAPCWRAAAVSWAVYLPAVARPLDRLPSSNSRKSRSCNRHRRMLLTPGSATHSSSAQPAVRRRLLLLAVAASPPKGTAALKAAVQFGKSQRVSVADGGTASCLKLARTTITAAMGNAIHEAMVPGDGTSAITMPPRGVIHPRARVCRLRLVPGRAASGVTVSMCMQFPFGVMGNKKTRRACVQRLFASGFGNGREPSGSRSAPRCHERSGRCAGAQAPYREVPANSPSWVPAGRDLLQTIRNTRACPQTGGCTVPKDQHTRDRYHQRSASPLQALPWSGDRHQLTTALPGYVSGLSVTYPRGSDLRASTACVVPQGDPSPGELNESRFFHNGASRDPDRLLRRVEAAAALNAAGFPISPKTLATMVSRGRGPPYQVFGRIPLYRFGDLMRWAAARLTAPRTSSSEVDTT